jgi:hypothetical protein
VNFPKLGSIFINFCYSYTSDTVHFPQVAKSLRRNWLLNKGFLLNANHSSFLWCWLMHVFILSVVANSIKFMVALITS